jgi:hypothetical protein
MAAHSSNGTAPVLELKPLLSQVAEVHETPTDIVVRIRLQQGALELSVPKRALCETRPALKNVVPGANPDATPC